MHTRLFELTDDAALARAAANGYIPPTVERCASGLFSGGVCKRLIGNTLDRDDRLRFDPDDG